ncbi:MAG: sugar-binding domain-containing protein [Pseudomonadota bacterium]
MTTDRDAEDEYFLTEVCWHYYVNEMTQSEIAGSLGVTRLRVNQAIQQAKSNGMVKVQIESRALPRMELQTALCEKYNLKNAVVALANRESYDYHLAVGAALASYLSESIKANDWKKIGVSWGVTLQNAINKMLRQSLPDREIITLMGGTSKGANFNTFSIASGFAERLGASYSLLAAPIFLSPDVDRESFLAQDFFADHFQKFHELDAVILTASNISSLSYLVNMGLPHKINEETLVGYGAIGDVVGRFLDSRGMPVSTELDSCTIGIELDVLEKVNDRILAAAGEHKVRVIHAALSRGIANILVTDDVTAEKLLEME